MPVKASDIQKKLPKGGKLHCKKCGFPTCLAFAMKLVAGGTHPDKCPELEPDVKEWIIDAITPPIRRVTVGTGENALVMGEEEVMFRHEKTFLHAPGLAVLVSDKDDEQAAEAKLNKLKELQFEWVAINLKADMVAVKFEGIDKDRYLSLVSRAAREELPMVLMSEDLDVLFAACDLVADKKPLLYPITKENIEAALPVIKEKNVPVGVRGRNLEEITVLTARLKAAGVTDLVIDPSPENLQDAVRDYTLIRRSALIHNYRPLGYPIISLLALQAEDAMEEVLMASTLVTKYASIIVLSDLHKDTLFTLLVHRLNIYTDPRVPLAVEEKIYEFGTQSNDTPIFVTTNFALTYFAVASAVEATKRSALVIPIASDGLCVLAAWSTGKFLGDTIGAYIKKSGLDDKLSKKRLIIPGMTARLLGEIEDELPEWKVIVGPTYAEDIPAFMAKMQSKWEEEETK
ncbi:MAG: acetyl-CoA decarbonylase/synthase complex subunit gamma [Firmicutes bacterium]|nr:acetyl-CoA decarbonylase/synthase complex subunit gamma [Bacillota bacterium]